MEWAKFLMMNSCDVLLVDRINKKFDELDLYEQGGVTYIKIALDEMFTKQHCCCNPPGIL